MSDIEYFEGIRNRVVTVENHFYLSNKNMIMGMIRKKDSRGDCDLQDLYQEAVSVVMHKITAGKLTSEIMRSKLSTYLGAVALNLFNDHLKIQNKRLKVFNSIQSEAGEDASDITEEDKFLFETSVLNLVKQIKNPCNKMLIDRYVSKLSYDEIAIKYNYKNYNGAKKKNGECLQKAKAFVKENIKPEINIYYAR